MNTLGHELTDADVCRANGWNVGSILEGDEGYGTDQIAITAIGKEIILAAKWKDGKLSSESTWTLRCRDWQKVGYSSQAVGGVADGL